MVELPVQFFLGGRVTDNLVERALLSSIFQMQHPEIVAGRVNSRRKEQTMRRKWVLKKWVILSAVFLLVASFVSAGNAKELVFEGKVYDIAEPGETIPGTVIVQMQPGTTIQGAQSVAGQLGGSVTGIIEEYGLYRVKLGSATGTKAAPEATAQAIASTKNMPGVKTAFADVKVSIPRPVGAPGPSADVGRFLPPAPKSDAGIQGSSGQEAAPTINQWHLSAIGWNKAGSPPATTPVVAVIDTGVDYTHPDLAASGKVILGKDYVDDDMDPMDEQGHGTHCAGLVAASGTYMVRGVSQNTKILAVRVLNASGSGSGFDIMAAIVWARKQANVKILSMSFGGYYLEGSDDYNAYKQVVDDTVAAGVLPVVAAGNEYNYNLYYYQYYYGNYRPCPAWFPSSFTVGATNENDMRTYFSNYDIGTVNSLAYNYSFVDIVAPGYNILSSTFNGQVVRMSGTSMATPIVAGAAAFYWGKFSTKTLAQVETALTSTGTAVNVFNGFPVAEKRLDLRKAVGVSATGFVGVVYNAQTGRPLQGATVKVTQGSTTVTVSTDYEGFFTATSTSFVGGTACTLTFSKTGFSTYTRTGLKATSNAVLNLTKPVFMNFVRAGQWSIIIDNRSWMPGRYEAGDTYSGRDSWYPYNWDMTAGAFPVPYVSSTSLGTLDLGNLGSLTASPFMMVMTNPYLYYHPATTFVIKPQTSQTYKVYTVLAQPNTDGYYSWGSYVSNSYSQPAVQARIYYGSALKATVNPKSPADPSKPYWHIGDITGTTYTPANEYLAAAP
jgi:subtilisin family serine protease